MVSSGYLLYRVLSVKIPSYPATLGRIDDRGYLAFSPSAIGFPSRCNRPKSPLTVRDLRHSPHTSGVHSKHGRNDVDNATNRFGVQNMRRPGRSSSSLSVRGSIPFHENNIPTPYK